MATFRAWWSDEDGQEFLGKWFGVKNIAKYFHTRSPISAADIDGWCARELMAPLFMGDNEEFHSLIRVHLIPASFAQSSVRLRSWTLELLAYTEGLAALLKCGLRP